MRKVMFASHWKIISYCWVIIIPLFVLSFVLLSKNAEAMWGLQINITVD